MWQDEIRKNVRFNFTVNVLDAAFYGVGVLGLASFVTVIPLFLNSLHASTLLIGLITSFHAIGWQLPQLFTASRVSKMKQYKPFVMWMTLHERWPFVGLMLIAILLPFLGEQLALVLTVLMVLIFALGGGLAANAWQSMIAKVMPKNRIGTFYGTQSGVANLTAAVGAVAAGFILKNMPFPQGYIVCFFITSVTVFISMAFLGVTREPHHDQEMETSPEMPHVVEVDYGWRKMWGILREDVNFRWFLTARTLAQFANVALAFYTLYAVKHFGMNEQMAGILTGVLLLSKTVASPLLGWVGDRWGHRTVLVSGALIMSLAAAMAISAPSVGWFYVIYALAGLADASMWTVAMAFTQAFGVGSHKPLYIGLANTLTAPFALLAPFIGGALADSFGFGATFSISIVTGLLAAWVFQYGVRDPEAKKQTTIFNQPAAAGD
ncbi:MAG: MFS transporter [Anaerolineaceae bacterium]|nr:MFS transporter [Anaerolineaceae bacterium]